MSRITCSTCLRPQVTCYCHLVKKLKNKNPILILRHPDEKKHSISTASIAQKVLDNILIIDGVDFSQNIEVNTFIEKYNPTLIYDRPEAKEFSTESFSDSKAFILIDGTWKKTYKILKLSSNLRGLEMVKLAPKLTSIMNTRIPPKAHFLSTLESIVYILESTQKKSFTEALEPLKYIQDQKVQIIKSKNKETK